MKQRDPDEFRVLTAIDIVVFGFEQNDVKVLLVGDDSMESYGWKLPGSYVQASETLAATAVDILAKTTGLKQAYMEFVMPFDRLSSCSAQRVLRICYLLLINMKGLNGISDIRQRVEWFPIDQMPVIQPDEQEIIQKTIVQLRLSAIRQPIMFELLDERFTLPELVSVYENVFGRKFDVRNFVRKFLSTSLLIKQNEKSKETSRKGAYYYKLDHELYSLLFDDPHMSVANMISTRHKWSLF
jgi:8-oxo-dGTP diphosphatase